MVSIPVVRIANNQPKDDRTRNEIEKMGCPSETCKQKTAPESEKVDPALKFMLNISLARESVRQAHTLFFVIRG